MNLSFHWPEQFNKRLTQIRFTWERHLYTIHNHRTLQSFILILLALAFVYHDALLYNYYFADDEHIYPGYLFTRSIVKTIFHMAVAITNLLLYLSVATYSIAETVQLAHLISLLLVCTLIFTIYSSLKTVFPDFYALMTAIFLGCLPTFQIHVTYARIFTYTIGYILCYFAVEALYSKNFDASRWFIFSILLVISYHMFQAAPFFVLPFLLIKTMQSTPESTPERTTDWRTITLATISMCFVIGACAVLYKILFTTFNIGADRIYKKASLPLNILSGDITGLLNNTLVDSLNVFEIWSYLFPVEILSKSIRLMLYVGAPLMLMLLAVCRYVVNGKQKGDLFTMATGAIFFLLAMIPAAMDGFGSRQHLYAAAQSILVLMLFWALIALPRGRVVGVALAVVMMAATTVQFSQKLVLPYVFAYEYASREVKAAGSAGESIKIVVVLATGKSMFL